MANPVPATFQAYVLATPDPHMGDPGALDRSHDAADPAITAEQLFQGCDNPLAPLFYMGSSADTSRPLPLCALFSTNMPGLADNDDQKYAFVGDVGAEGSEPPVVVLDQTVFDPIPEAATVPTAATLLAAWAARPANQDRISIPAAGTEQVRTRHIWPIPRPHVPAILASFAANTLTWQWLIDHVVTSILGDAPQAAAYSGFVNWIRVSSTLRPPDGAGNPVPPQTDMAFAAVFALPRVLAARRPMLVRFLSGFGRPHGLEQHMASLVQQNQQLATSVAQMQQRPERNLAQAHPLLADMARKVAEATSLADLPKDLILKKEHLMCGNEHHVATIDMMKQKRKLQLAR